MSALACLPALALLLVAPFPAMGQQPEERPHRATETMGSRLWRLLWAPTPTGPLSRAFGQARERLSETCDAGRPGCFRAHLEPRELTVDTLRRAPRADAEPAGVLTARLVVREATVSGEPVALLRWDLMFRPVDGADAIVLRELDDWTYGVHWYVPARDGRWVPLPGTGGWLDAGPPDERGGPYEVDRADGDLVTLEEPVTARRAGTEQEVHLGAGGDASHYVLEVGETTVRLRPERPADFELPCQGIRDAEPETTDLPVYRVRIRDLFRPDGTARLRPTYPKGC